MLELEEFAKLQAAIERAASASDVLRAKAVTGEQWLEAGRRWHEAFAREIEDGSDALAQRYLAAYGSVDEASPPSALPERATPAPASAPVAVAAPHMPSYLRMGGTPMGLGGLGAPPTTAAPSSGGLGGGISALTSKQELRAMPPPLVTPVVSRDPLAIPTPAARMERRDEPQAPGQALPAPVLSSPVEPQAPPRRMSSTAEHAAPKNANATLPFQTPRADRPAELGPVSRGRRRRNVEMPAHIAALKGTSSESTGTLSLDESSAPRSGSPLPFQGSLADTNRPSERKRLSVDQFAWIVATVESTPFEAVDAVLSRMRMTRSQYAAMGKYWQTELGRDPALAAQFAQALATERAKRRASP